MWQGLSCFTGQGVLDLRQATGTSSGMAQSASIATVNFSHEAVIDWMLSNPYKNLGVCATAFGYTQSWLSTVIHSDAFRAEYQRRRNQLNEMIANGIQSRMAEVSKKALEHLEEYLGKDTDDLDPRLVLDIADRTLHRQGYAPSKSGVTVFQQNNVVNNNAVPRAVLEEARGIMHAINGPPAKTAQLEHTTDSSGTGQ